jgi:membrane fusion protein (multidrug efflux system)
MGPDTASPTPGLSKYRFRRFALLVVVPAIVGVVAGGLYLHGGRYVDTDNAYVKADLVTVSPDVAGTVKEVLVQENQAVSAGQVLFRIDPASYQVAVDQAEARLAQVRTDLLALTASYREKQAEIALARTRYEFARREQRRQADLVAKHFVSASKFDDATQASDIAGQQITAQEEDLKRIAASLGGSVDTPLAQQAGYRAAQAALEQARLDLARTEVRASLPGTVSSPPKPGQYLAAGGPAMALVVTGNTWIEANFTETDLTYVRPGEAAVVHVDTYPGVEWRGTVDSLSPATGSEFSVIPAQNATGNWVKITQRVPVRIRIEPQAGLPALRAGLSALVDIDTGHRRHLFGLAW